MKNRLHIALWKIKLILLEDLRKVKYKQRLKKLESYKQKYCGKRCFVIGTGPSLTAADLSKLKEEYTFASNSIFRYLDQTDWSPDFYSVCDKTYYKANKEKCDTVKPNEFRAFPLDFIPVFGINEGALYYSRVAVNKKHNRFSIDPLKGLDEGSTVTYFLLQLAVFMGFTEIYLLGIDFNYSKSKDNKGNIIEKNNVRDYAFNDKASNYTLPNLEASLYAYQAAQDYCKMHTDIKIYNATRGGMLEVFPRVNFDELF